MSDVDLFEKETGVPKGQPGHDKLRKLRPFTMSNTSTRETHGRLSVRSFC
jgi:hypothetical protein